MKKLILTSLLALLVTAAATAIPQEYPEEYLGLPGDNLNLYAVMKLFQESETLEGFERSLNDENSRINNLDLNSDNLIDYITVQDYVDGNVHTIVLRTALNRNEFQDVAVFTVQKFRDGSVQIQLVGDEDLYGSNYIIEPIYDETPNPGYTGNASRRVTVTVVRTTPYEVAVWPLIRYIYMPNYVIWRSSWYWGYYPSYWRPWRPYYWHYYYGYHYHWYHHYYNHYRIWHVHRYPRYNDFYYRSVRAHSPYVSQRIREGHYRNTYSRPEQRREGEAYFSKAHPNQTRRTADNTPAVQQRRPTGQENTAGTVRRQATSDNQRSAVRSSSQQNSGDSRRSGTTVTDRPAGRSTSVQNQSTERRSSTNVNERPPAGRSTSVQNQSTQRRSSTNVNERPPAGRSTSVQNQSTERRSSTNVSDRPPVSRSTSVQNQSTGRRPATVNNSQASRSTAVQRSGTTRQPSATASQRSAPRQSTNVRTQSSSSRQPAARSRSTETRSSRSSAPAQSSKRSSEKRESSGSSRPRR